MNRSLLKEMFSEMVLKKDISLASRYYHPDFVLETNGQQQGYADFVAGHERVYPTSIGYDVRYDEASWVESADKVAARLWITTRRPGEAAVEMQVVLIATYRDGRILHLLELTWPDWTQVKALESY
ncbi:nuclear transport factor 2 family protein [Variovorax sp. J22P168]|uniref:nuclear transport factor 2 family protein n=1 Tax=Variovorax jilinensis TaxID=3053513 RepID=UPI002574BBA1|nr:nuclear transport factor 2 family protein [Variovorax sp. J22P168]MDM0012499.1 nuclear transport factor 2 family protein [Variovorax sp. J22P168]